MKQAGSNRFNPKRWTALTWMAVLLWAWEPIVLNYPPSVSYAQNRVTGEFTEATHYKALSEIPFPVGWPLHYVQPSSLSAAPAPVMPVGTPFPPLPPSGVSPFAMAANFLIVVVTIGSLVYLLQRFMNQFSLLTLFKISLAFALVWGLGRLIGTFAGYRAAGWYSNAIYFSPIAAAIAVKIFGVPNIDWSIFRLGAQPSRPAFADYDDADDALAAASKLDRNGDWNGSINLYRLTAERWPEHNDYIQNCIDRIVEKQSLAQT